MKLPKFIFSSLEGSAKKMPNPDKHADDDDDKFKLLGKKGSHKKVLSLVVRPLRP